MKAIVLRKNGGPDVLKTEEAEEPRPGKGEVRVAVRFAGINYAEILSRKGIYGWAPKKPYIPGMECSGVIEEAGEGVSRSRIGERRASWSPTTGGPRRSTSTAPATGSRRR